MCNGALRGVMHRYNSNVTASAHLYQYHPHDLPAPPPPPAPWRLSLAWGPLPSPLLPQVLLQPLQQVEVRALPRLRHSCWGAWPLLLGARKCGCGGGEGDVPTIGGKWEQRHAFNNGASVIDVMHSTLEGKQMMSIAFTNASTEKKHSP